jgi:hypothetical protein
MDEAARAKWRNLVTLVVAGMWGVFLLVTVDMDSWRGWTLSEIVLRIPCACSALRFPFSFCLFVAFPFVVGWMDVRAVERSSLALSRT